MTAQPRLAACCVSQVLGEPYDTSTTTPLDGCAASSIGSAAPGSAVLSDEAFTSSVTSPAILIGSRSLNSTSDGAAGVSVSMNATNRCPDSGERLATVIDATPAWAIATAITRASRPDPISIAFGPA